MVVPYEREADGYVFVLGIMAIEPNNDRHPAVRYQPGV